MANLISRVCLHGTVPFQRAFTTFPGAIDSGLPRGTPMATGGDAARLMAVAEKDGPYVHMGGFPGTTKPRRLAHQRVPWQAGKPVKGGKRS